MMVDEDFTIVDVAAPSEVKPAHRRRIRAARAWIRRWLTRWRPIMLTILLIAATGIAVGLYHVEYRLDRQTNGAAAHEVIRAASDGAVALLSYSPDSLSRDVDNAKSRLTSDFQAYYERFTERIVAPTAQGAQVTTSARVVRAAVAELHPNSAVALVFISQKTASKENPEPVTTSSAVRVTLTKANGSWLIAKFDTL
jgi:Mce-associated membrane protein